MSSRFDPQIFGLPAVTNPQGVLQSWNILWVPVSSAGVKLPLPIDMQTFLFLQTLLFLNKQNLNTESFKNICLCLLRMSYPNYLLLPPYKYLLYGMRRGREWFYHFYHSLTINLAHPIWGKPPWFQQSSNWSCRHTSMQCMIKCFLVTPTSILEFNLNKWLTIWING